MTEKLFQYLKKTWNKNVSVNLTSLAADWLWWIPGVLLALQRLVSLAKLEITRLLCVPERERGNVDQSLTGYWHRAIIPVVYKRSMRLLSVYGNQFHNLVTMVRVVYQTNSSDNVKWQTEMECLLVSHTLDRVVSCEH